MIEEALNNTSKYNKKMMKCVTDLYEKPIDNKLVKIEDINDNVDNVDNEEILNRVRINNAFNKKNTIKYKEEAETQ